MLHDDLMLTWNMLSLSRVRKVAKQIQNLMSQIMLLYDKCVRKYRNCLVFLTERSKYVWQLTPFVKLKDYPD